MNNLFLSGVPERILMNISDKNNYVAKIIKNLGVTYSHTIKIIQRLEDKKIITKIRIGRKILITLTPKGLKLQNHMLEIKRLLL